MASKLKVSWDQRCLVGVANIRLAMDTAARTAPVGVIILSKSSFSKKWPLRKMQIIGSAGNSLVPVLIDLDFASVKAQLVVPPDGDPGSLRAIANDADWKTLLIGWSIRIW